MDVGDDNKDVRLYRASGDLIPELHAKLPSLLWHSPQDGQSKSVRCWILEVKVAEIITLIDRFQEWPQLLDPRLDELIKPIADAFLTYITAHHEQYPAAITGKDTGATPLPQVACQLLYLLMKVRGLKVIVRFLNNEPKYLEPMIISYILWNYPEEGVSTAIWEERYVMLIWLSHLMLTPFDLSSIASVPAPPRKTIPHSLPHGLPTTAFTLLAIALDSLVQPSKAREAASLLIVRLALRTDMQRLNLASDLVKLAINRLVQESDSHVSSVYYTLGFLSLLSSLMTSGSDEDVAHFCSRVFNFCLDMMTNDSTQARRVRDSAPARKLLIKTIRQAMLHSLSLNKKSNPNIPAQHADAMVEEVVQLLLECLADKDTPVRLASSKALSMITFRLDSQMAAEVTQAVIDSFSENLLFEHIDTRDLVSATDPKLANLEGWRPNFGAVDPLRWHGLMLSLGHLLFRRAPPPNQISSILRILVSGLSFEQRSPVGTSIGVGVRDAACFGIWSLARKYSTHELEFAWTSYRGESPVITQSASTGNVVQVLAQELVISACLDPSGNIRRGSSAALQELIGRHPDTVEEGISLVQAVDYHEVARRSRAMTEVGVAAANLSKSYETGILDALFEWRGSCAADADSRRLAATATRLLLRSKQALDVLHTAKGIFDRLKRLKQSNTGTNAEARHGYLLALSSCIDVIQVHHVLPADVTLRDKSSAAPSGSSPPSNMIPMCWQNLETLCGDVSGRTTRELEYVYEASCHFISSMAQVSLATPTGPPVAHMPFDESQAGYALHVVQRSQDGSEKEFVVEVMVKATLDLLRVIDAGTRTKIIRVWLKDNFLYSGRTGKIMALGAAYLALVTIPATPLPNDESLESEILENLVSLVLAEPRIETKIAALKTLTSIFADPHSRPAQQMQTKFGMVVLAALDNYQIDRRGDVGSNLRLEGIKAVSYLMERDDISTFRDWKTKIGQSIVRLAAEKLDKVRFQAWLCLQDYWPKQEAFPALKETITHPADVSSTAYFRQLLDLLHIDWLQPCLIEGIISSASSGTEELGRAARSALVSFVHDQPGEKQELTKTRLFIGLTELLQRSGPEDRKSIPAIDLVAFLIDQECMPHLKSEAADSFCAIILDTVTGFQSPKSSLQMVEAMVRVFASLAIASATPKPFLDKLTRILLHRYPKIRNAAAEALYLSTEAESLLIIDWSRPVSELKPTVLALRKELQVT